MEEQFQTEDCPCDADQNSIEASFVGLGVVLVVAIVVTALFLGGHIVNSLNRTIEDARESIIERQNVTVNPPTVFSVPIPLECSSVRFNSNTKELFCTEVTSGLDTKLATVK